MRIRLGILVALALLAAVSFALVGAASSSDDAVANITVENDGTASALGVPAAVEGSWAEQFSNGTEGVGGIYTYDDGWVQVTDLANESPGALEAYRITTTGVGEDTIDMQLRFETALEEPAETTVGPGWAFVPPAEFGEAEDAFEHPEWVSVLQRHATPAVDGTPSVDRFSHHTVGSGDRIDSAATVSPFGGYYLYTERESTRTGAVSDVHSIHDLRTQLGASDPYPHFAVDLESNTPVLEDETLSLEGTVTNLGTATGTQTVTVAVANETVTEEVTLAPRETSTVSLEWTPAVGAAGEYTATITSEDATATHPVIVVSEGEPAFEVTDVTPNETSLVAGEPYTVSATVTNVGDAAGEETVTLSLEDSAGDPGVVANETVSLAVNESTTVTFENVSTETLGGTYSVTVESPHDNATATLDVVAQVESLSLSFEPESVPAGQETVAIVTAELSDGTVEDRTAEAAISSADRGIARLEGGTITTRQEGTVTITAAHPAGTINETLTITRGTLFDVEILETNQPIREGESLDVDVRVTNTGLVRGQQPITLTAFDGTEAHVRPVTLQPAGHVRDSHVRTLTWKTTLGDAGTDTIAVSSLDASDETTVTVESATVTSLSLSLEAETIAVGETTNATTSGTLDNETTTDLTPSVSLESSNESVVTVEDGFEDNGSVVPGQVTGVGEGSATVTATGDTESDSVTVTVDGETDGEMATLESASLEPTDTDNETPPDPGSALPVQELTVENDGSPKAVGIPGPMNGTLDALFPEGTAGIGTVYGYDGGWEQLHTFDTVELEALDAIAFTTRGDVGPDTITLEVPFALEEPPTDRHLDPGWNLVGAPAVTDAESAFGTNLDGITGVTNRFDGPTVGGEEYGDSFSHYSTGSWSFGASVPEVSPYSAYFVYASEETAVPTVVSDLETGADLADQLGTD